MELYDQPSTRNVLVAVDVQHDFIDGSLAVPGGEYVVEPLNRLAEAVRATEMGRVAFTRDWHPAVTPHFDTWPVHCVQDTEGARFSPALDIQPEDVIVSKGMGQTDGYSGMEGVAPDGTTLETLIEPDGWENVRVFLGGLATDYCVRATAVDIARAYQDRENVSIYAIRDAIRAVNVNPTDEAAALADMSKAGVKFISLDKALTMVDKSRLEA